MVMCGALFETLGDYYARVVGRTPDVALPNPEAYLHERAKVERNEKGELGSAYQGYDRLLEDKSWPRKENFEMIAKQLRPERQ